METVAESKHPFDDTGQRYILSDPSSRADKSLCDCCSRIDFQAIYEIDPGSVSTSDWSIVYELNLQDSTATQCRLCSSFASYMLECIAETDVPWRNDAKPGNGCIAVRREFSLDGMPRLALGIGHHDLTNLVAPGGELMALPLPAESGNPSGITGSGDDFHTSTRVDYSWLMSSLFHCAKHHEHDLDVKVASIPDIWLVDCQTRTIIEAPTSAVYLALSYVWGKPARGPPSCTGLGTSFGPGVLSQLIEDAIAVTVSMGLRYLWADQLCIDQISPRRKRRQIQAMGDIYTGAYATILGLGPDSDTGLDGVSRARKPLRGIRAAGAVIFPSDTEDLTASSEMIEASLWNRRGWTFQEGLLSKRLIFFSPSRVMIMCDKATICEPDPTCCPDGHYWETARSFEMRQRLWKVHFERDVVSYSARALTYPADGLDAFRGYLSNFAPWTQWGTPLQDHTADVGVQSPYHYFVSWMLWLVDNGLRSQKSRSSAELPTWSWVTSRNISIPEHYPPHTAHCMAQQLFFERNDGSHLSISDLTAACSLQGKHLAEETRFLHVAAPVLSVRLDRKAWGESGYVVEATENCHITWPFEPDQLQIRLWFSPDHTQHPVTKQASYDCAFLILERGQRSWDFPWWFCGIVIDENSGGHYERLGAIQAVVEWRKTPEDRRETSHGTFDVREGEELYTTKQDGLTTLVSSHEADGRFAEAVRDVLEGAAHPLVKLG